MNDTFNVITFSEIEIGDMLIYKSSYKIPVPSVYGGYFLVIDIKPKGIQLDVLRTIEFLWFKEDGSLERKTILGGKDEPILKGGISLARI